MLHGATVIGDGGIGETLRLVEVVLFDAQARGDERGLAGGIVGGIRHFARLTLAVGVLDRFAIDRRLGPPGRTARRDKETAASLARMRQDVREEEAADLDAIERAHQSLAQVITDELDQREKYVILNRFGPIGQPIKKKTKTLGQIGEELALSKERVRQIELLALQKLRQSLSPKEFELLTR